MIVGPCLRDRGAFTTRQNSLISYGKLYGFIHGNKKCPSSRTSIKKRNSLFFKGIALTDFF